MTISNRNKGLEGLKEALGSALALDNGIGAALRFLSGEEGREVQRNSLALGRDRLEQTLFDLEQVCGEKVRAKDCRDRAADLAGRLEAIAADRDFMDSLTEAEANLIREACDYAADVEAAMEGLIEENLPID